MLRRAALWAALSLFTAFLTANSVPALADPGNVTWILLGGKGNASKVAGLQLYAEPALEESILLRLNGVLWADGYVVTDDECSSTHFHGEIGEIRERGRSCGLGLVTRYEESNQALRLASDAMMNNRRSQNALARVAFFEAHGAAQLGLTQLLELREFLRVPGNDRPTTRLLALSRLNDAIPRQERAVVILHNLATLTSNLHAIRRAERALRGAETATRRSFVVMSSPR